MTNAQWKAMLARNGELKPRLTRAERRELEKGWREQCKRFERLWMEEGFEDRLSRMRDQMNADISRGMGGYFGSDEDL